jgi:Fuc2NAc and GlcNAc transferase
MQSAGALGPGVTDSQKQSASFVDLMIVIVLFTVGAAGLSMLLTRVVWHYAVEKEILDRPVERSSHSSPTPRGGGLAVLATIVIGLVVGASLHLIDSRHAFALGGGIIILGTIGWIDDTRGLNARIRFLVHVMVAVWTLFMWGGMPEVAIGESSVKLGPAGFIVAALGLVWSINLFNFMDGIDGLAGSQAALIQGGTAILLWSKGANSLALVSAVAASAAAGFLVWNWPPAKIFLGDVGSGALGYLICAIAIESENAHAVPIFAIIVLAGVFLSDATITLVRRSMRGYRPTEAHRDHAYQRLARVWRSHRAVTLVAAGVTVVLLALAAIAAQVSKLALPIYLAGFVFLAALLWVAERLAPLEKRPGRLTS